MVLLLVLTARLLPSGEGQQQEACAGETRFNGYGSQSKKLSGSGVRAGEGTLIRCGALWSAVDPTLPSPLPCYGPLTQEAAYEQGKKKDARIAELEEELQAARWQLEQGESIQTVKSASEKMKAKMMAKTQTGLKSRVDALEQRNARLERENKQLQAGLEAAQKEARLAQNRFAKGAARSAPTPISSANLSDYRKQAEAERAEVRRTKVSTPLPPFALFLSLCCLLLLSASHALCAACCLLLLAAAASPAVKFTSCRRPHGT